MTEDRAQVLFLPRRMVWSFVVLFMLFYIQIIPVSAAPPDLASDLTVEAITTTGAKVRWTRTPAATPPTINNYVVSITPSAGISFTPGPTITGTAANPETTISGLTAGVEYTVSVSTVNGTDKGTPKNATFNAKPNPVPNTSLSVTNPQSTTATASWSAPNSPGTFTEYIVSISPNTGGATAVSPVASGTTTSSLTNLIAGNQYTVGVKTKSGMSDSDVVTKTFTTKPIAVGSINDVTVFTTNSATLTWAAVTAGTFTNYVISISPTTGGVTVSPNTVPKGAATTTLLTKLTGGTTYTVTLKTISTDGMESDPVTKQFTTKPDKVDSTSLTVGNTATTTTATLTWDAVTTPFLTYEITISPTAGGAKANPASVAKGTTTAALESLTPGTEYTVTITTKNGGLESDPATMKFRTKPQPVVESTISVTGKTTTTATVSWEKVATGIFNTYSISVVPPATITPTPVNNTVDAPTVDLSGLSPGTEYTITLKTVSGGKESDAATKTFTTKPSAVVVGTITFPSITLVSATVTWFAVASADEYDVGIQPSTSTTPSITHSPSSATTASFAGLSAGVEYNVSITSNKTGEVGDTTTKTFRTKPPNLGGRIVIEAKEMTTAAAKWTKPATGTFTNYKITVTSDDTGIATPTVNSSTVPSGVTSPSVALSGLVAGQVYTVSVLTNWDGVDGTATTEKFRTKPDKVSNIQIDPLATTTATIKWTPPTIDAKYTAIYKYQVDIEPPGPTVNPDEVPHPGSSTGVTGMTPGATYKVKVITEAGNETLVVMSDPVEHEFTAMPEQVTGITIETVTTTTATITWEKVSSGRVDSYSISASPAGATISPITVSGSVTNLRTSLSQLTPGVQYTITISSIAGIQTVTATKAFFTKPHPVSSVDVENVTRDSALLTWDEVDTGEFESYRVSISPTGPTIIPINETDPSSQISDLSPGVEYTVTVITVAGDMESEPAVVKFTTIPIAVDVDSIVIDSSATDSANVTWAMVNGTVDTYTIEVSPSGPAVTPSSVNSGDAAFSSLTNLSPGAHYNVTIVSMSGNQSSASASKSFWTIPLPVTGVTLKQTGNKMTITWIAGVGSTQSRYNISYHAIFQNPTPDWPDVTVNHPTLTTEISITPGEKYEVNVTAISGNKSSDIAPASLVTAPFPPASVSVNNASATNTSIEVAWTAPTSTSYFIKYIIKYTKEGTTTTKQVEATSTELKKTIPGLEAGVKYAVQVFTSSNESKMSSTSKDTNGTVKPNCDVVVTDLSNETNKLNASFTESSLVFTNYKFVIANGPLPATKTPPKGTPSIELVYEQGVTPGNKYTLTASCVSNDIESDAKEYFLSSVPAPVTQVERTPSFDSAHMTIYKPVGTVSSVKISCSGRSTGTLNGCTFPKSGIFTRDTYDVKYDKLDSFENYTFTITVTSNGKKSAPYVVDVKTLEGRPGLPDGFTATALSPTSLKLEWKTPVDPNGKISTYMVKYTGTYKANPSLKLPRDKKNVTFDGLDPNAGSYVKTLERLKGGYVYELLLYGKTTYPAAGENAATSVTMPTAAPTLAVGAKSPELPVPGTQNETTIIKAVFYKAFNESNGPILYYSVIVAENKDEKTVLPNPELDDTILTWKQVKDTEDWPPYMAIRHCDIFDPTKNCQGSPTVRVGRRKRSTTGDSVELTIGIQDCKNKGNGDFCNGALKAGTHYQLRLRGYTGDKNYTDTPYSKRIPTSHVDQTGVIVGVVVGLLVVLFIAAGVAVYFFIKYKKAEKEKKYRESQPDGPPSSPTDRNRPVRLSDFPGHHAFMHADTDFRFAEEYEDLKDVGINQSYHASELPHNRVKNRFTNILPYDWSRVKLSPLEDEEGSDYINANYIPGFTSKREYIACQGPLVSTKDDFWRMIWEQNSQAIVMLTRCVENGREKCSHYWPEDTDPVMYGDIEVVILNETQTPDYSITQLRITNGSHNRKICHFHFKGWPDFSAPDEAGALLRFLYQFRNRIGFDSSRPVCVHCSAGVGRSGTFITLDRLAQHMKQHDYVDIYGTVHEMRMHRRYMVQTEQQYIFIHRAILDIINDTVKTSAPASPASGRENPAFEDIPLNDKKISDDEGITLEVLS